MATIHIANLFQVNQVVKETGKTRTSTKYSFDNHKHWVWYKTNVKKGQTTVDVNSKRGYKDDTIANILINGDDKPRTADDFILSTKFPHPGKDNRMHRVYQYMVVVMAMQMEYMNLDPQNEAIPPTHECIMSFNAKLGYSDKKEVLKESDWKLLTYSRDQKRPLTCRFTHIEKTSEKGHDGYYSCDDQHLFELGSVAHKHYILNLQFPSVENNKHCLATNVSYFGGIHLTVSIYSKNSHGRPENNKLNLKVVTNLSF